MINFCDLNGLRNLINVPTCYKIFDNPTSIDLILTNRQSYFQPSKVFENELSDFHLLTISEFKTSFQKQEPKIIKYHDYKNFDRNKFRYEILKGRLIRIWKSAYILVFIKIIPWKFAFLILGTVELYTCKVCEMFVYKHIETTEYVKH